MGSEFDPGGRRSTPKQTMPARAAVRILCSGGGKPGKDDRSRVINEIASICEDGRDCDVSMTAAAQFEQEDDPGKSKLYTSTSIPNIVILKRNRSPG